MVRKDVMHPAKLKGCQRLKYFRGTLFLFCLLGSGRRSIRLGTRRGFFFFCIVHVGIGRILLGLPGVRVVRAVLLLAGGRLLLVLVGRRSLLVLLLLLVRASSFSMSFLASSTAFLVALIGAVRVRLAWRRLRSRS